MDTDRPSAACAATTPSPPSDGGEGRGEKRFRKDQPLLSGAPFHEPFGLPPGFGLRQSSGAFGSRRSRKAAEVCRTPRRCRAGVSPIRFKAPMRDSRIMEASHEPPVWSSAFTRPWPPEGGTPNAGQRRVQGFNARIASAKSLPARSSRGEGEKHVANSLSKMRDSSSLYYGFGGRHFFHPPGEWPVFCIGLISVSICVHPWLNRVFPPDDRGK